MSIICPTVTAFDAETYTSQLGLVASFADRIHIDLMDGDFTPTQSPDPNLLWIVDGVETDIHVMYRKPNSILPRLLELKPKMVIVHAESDCDIPQLASVLRDKNIKTGIALLPETSVTDVEYILPHIQHVLIFGGHLGYHGGQADLNQLSKVKELKKHNRFLEIGWDGGANISNAKLLADSGIDVINVGSGIHKADKPATAYENLIDILKREAK